VAVTINKTGLALLKVGRLSDARRRLEEGRTIVEGLVSRNSSHNRMRELLGLHEDNLGAVAIARGDVEAALHHAARHRSIMERLTRFEPENVDWGKQMAAALRAGGTALRMRGDIAGAVRSHAKAVDVLDHALAQSRKTMLLIREMAFARIERARSLLAAGRPRDAAENADRAVAVLEPIRNEIVAQHALGNALLVQGDARRALGDRAGAEQAWAEALRVLRPLDAISLDPRIADAHVRVLVRLGRAEEAQPLIDQLIGIGYRNLEFEILSRGEV
jgi:tetratricopeptide (TPR) repeat protein